MAANGIDRTRSIKTTPSSASAARVSARKPATREVKTTGDEDARAESAALVEDLKDQLRKTETASEEYQKQLHVLQARLDEALASQNDIEQSSNQHLETVAALEVQLQESHRSTVDLQRKLEGEQQINNQERESASTRESELNDIIMRLKDSLAQRESRQSLSGEGSLSRATSFRGRSSPTPEKSRGPAALQRRDSSQNSSHLILQKDKVIEDLRLELAEAHLKVMEADRAGGGRLQALESQLLETRMSNAKLMEDNESYQFLLQEKTLSGGMASKFNNPSPPASEHLSRAPSRDQSHNLADELETVGEEEELGSLDRKKLEKELSAQKDQNKALTLYINRIIGKLLASENFEQLFENGTITANGPPPGQEAAKSNTDKELPQPPGADVDSNKENAGSGLLARAGSIFGGGRNKPRPRSYQPPVAPDHFQAESETGPRTPIEQSMPLASAVEDLTLAPRVPLTRGASARHSSNPRSHRRTTSEISPGTTGSMYTSRVSSGTLSPPLAASKRSSMQAIPNDHMSLAGTSEVSTPTLGLTAVDMSELRSIPSATPSDSGYGDSITTPSSPPRSMAASSTDGARATGGAATVSGKQMRPLRLVQEKAEHDAERKKANRGSWMGWFNKGPQAGQMGLPPPAGQVRPGSQEGK